MGNALQLPTAIIRKRKINYAIYFNLGKLKICIKNFFFPNTITINIPHSICGQRIYTTIILMNRLSIVIKIYPITIGKS